MAGVSGGRAAGAGRGRWRAAGGGRRAGVAAWGGVAGTGGPDGSDGGLVAIHNPIMPTWLIDNWLVGVLACEKWQPPM
jgi:hypothetical protein